MKEQIRQEIEKTQKRNEQMLRATIPCFTEVDYNRGYIDGLRYALALIEKHDVLDKIRAEIIELRSRQNVGVMECLDIIDKYRAESED